MKKIISLSKVFIKEFYQNLPIFDKKNNKFNRKSIFFWLISFVFIGITYVSYNIIKFLVDAGMPDIFLNLYFLILALFLTFQIILIFANIFFFSKDIEKVLHMPVKPEELLIAKLNTLLCMLYVTEGILGVVPLTLYGFMTHAHIVYYFWEIIILALFPILFSAVIGILISFIMRFSKLIKNKDMFQFIITIILLVSVFTLEFKAFQGIFQIESDNQAVQQFTTINERAEEANKYFLIINPSINMLLKPASITAIISFGKILLYDILGLIIFILIGRITYIKDILKNMVSYSKKKKQNINIEKSSKQNSKFKSYIIKEFKMLWREPVFFMNTVLPVIAILVTFIIIVITCSPIINQVMQYEEVSNLINNMTINAEIICYILIILQVLFSISSISLTAISREGKNATFIKNIPIKLYDQFIYKNVPQLILNFVVTVIVLGFTWYIIPDMKAIYIFALFIIATLINLINSYLMLIVDLRRPNLNWDTTYSVVKKSDNKFFQYALMILNVLFLLYIAQLLENMNIFAILIIEEIIFLVIFIIIDRCVKKWQNKLFNKII